MKYVETRTVLCDAVKLWAPAQKLFKAYDEKQMADFIKYIDAKSVMSLPPIVCVKGEGLLIDGYNRLAAYKKLGIETVSVMTFEYEDEREMEAHAIALNAKRRHLDKLTASKLALRLVDLMKPSKKETRDKQKKNAKNQHVNEGSGTTVPQPSNNRESTLRKAAKEVGVSPATVRMVKRVQDTKDQKLIEAMESKKITLADASLLAGVPLNDRHQKLDEFIKGAAESKGKAKAAAAKKRQTHKAVKAFGLVPFDNSTHKLKNIVLDLKYGLSDMLDELKSSGVSVEEHKSFSSLLSELMKESIPNFLAASKLLIRKPSKKAVNS